MEIAIVFAAALQLRALDPLLAVTRGVALSLVVTALWWGIGRRLPDAPFGQAARVFAALFVGQVALYAFHESAEAGLLPWSEALHAATEPYGPDGVYGRYISALLLVVPLAAAASRSTGPRPDEDRRALPAFGQGLAIAVALVLVASAELMGVVGRGRDASL